MLAAPYCLAGRGGPFAIVAFKVTTGLVFQRVKNRGGVSAQGSLQQQQKRKSMRFCYCAHRANGRGMLLQVKLNAI